MIAISYPKDEIDLGLKISILESEDIPYFVRGQYFGSLYPGPQIASYNERAIMVPEKFVERASELLSEFQEIENNNDQPLRDPLISCHFTAMGSCLSKLNWGA